MILKVRCALPFWIKVRNNKAPTSYWFINVKVNQEVAFWWYVCSFYEQHDRSLSWLCWLWFSVQMWKWETREDRKAGCYQRACSWLSEGKSGAEAQRQGFQSRLSCSLAVCPSISHKLSEFCFLIYKGEGQCLPGGRSCSIKIMVMRMPVHKHQPHKPRRYGCLQHVGPNGVGQQTAELKLKWDAWMKGENENSTLFPTHIPTVGQHDASAEL